MLNDSPQIALKPVFLPSNSLRKTYLFAPLTQKLNYTYSKVITIKLQWESQSKYIFRLHKRNIKFSATKISRENSSRFLLPVQTKCKDSKIHFQNYYLKHNILHCKYSKSMLASPRWWIIFPKLENILRV